MELGNHEQLATRDRFGGAMLLLAAVMAGAVGRGGAIAYANEERPAAQPPSASTAPAAGLESSDVKRPPAGISHSASTSAPATSGDVAVDSILDRLEIKGRAVTDLRCKVKNEQIEEFPVPDTQTDDGLLLFRRLEPNPKFLVRFDRFERGGVVRDKPDDRKWFVFDGQWLIERNDKTQRVVRRQAVRQGERIDVFKLGQGPFPLPFGQSRADMLANFNITRKPPAAGDPADTDHLLCIPRPGSELSTRYRSVDFFVDRKLEIPIRIEVLRVKDDVRIRVTFSAVELNTGLAASEFDISIPDGYAVTEEPLAEGD